MNVCVVVLLGVFLFQSVCMHALYAHMPEEKNQEDIILSQSKQIDTNTQILGALYSQNALSLTDRPPFFMSTRSAINTG
jgi:hypothetical protein